MNQTLAEILAEETPGEFHDKLLNHCKNLVDGSRSAMSHYYTKWDERDKVYQAERMPDKQDREAAKNNQPAKMTVPLTAAQVNTFVAFAFMVLHQRKRLFELSPVGTEDNPLREPLEVLLENDLVENAFTLQEYQFWLDLGRFGVGIFKHGWHRKVSRVMVPKQAGVGEVPEGTEYQDVVSFEGNRVMTVSPYRFFPDTRLPLTRFQEGEFCACEDEYTKTALLRMEASGEVKGVKYVKPFYGESLATRQKYSRFNSIKLDGSTDVENNMICVTECQVRIVPAEFEVDGKFPLGEEKFPVMFLVWYANDSRVIKAEPMTAYHDSFGYEVAQISPDQHHQLNQSLSELISKLQDSVDWFINSRMLAVTRTLDNQLVVDPSVVNMSSLENRSRIIQLQRGVARAGLDRYIKPLPVVDVTTRHTEDANILIGMAQAATGINDNALGQYHSGRRSATEAHAVTQGGSSRLLTTINLAWVSAYAQLGRKMVLNHRQYLDQTRFNQVVGTGYEETFQAFKADPETLITARDVFVYDGTLPSSKQFLAQTLQELLGLVLSNPQAAVQFQLDPKRILEEIYLLRGLGRLSHLQSQTPAMDPAMIQAVMAQLQTPQANVQ